MADDDTRHDRRKDDYWMGQIAAKLDSLKEWLEREITQTNGRMDKHEARLDELEKAHHTLVVKIAVLSSSMGILGAKLVDFLH